MRSPLRHSRIVVLALVGALAGAGGAQAQTTQPAPPPLSPDRVQGIQPAAEAAVVLDAINQSPSKLRRLARACRTSTFTDALVRDYRAVCRAEGAGVTAERRVANCKTPDRCRARLDRNATTLTQQLTASRRLNKRLPSAVTDPDCRRALRVPQATLVVITHLKSSTTAMQSALKVGSQKRFAAALKRFYAQDRSALLDHQGRLDRFRASCI